MSNLVPQNGGVPAAYDGDDNPWADVARDVESGDYFKFNGNTGEMSFGADDEPMPEGSRVICDMYSMEHGWTCWIDSEVEEEVYIPITEGKPPAEHTLKQYDVDDEDDGWREGIKIPMIIEQYGDDPEDETVGTRLLFNSTTGGVVRSAKKLSGAFGKGFRQNPNALPVVELTVDSYIPKQKKHGRKYSLLFKIVGWMGLDEIAELVGEESDEDGEYADEAPAIEQQEEEAPAKEPEVEEQEEAPAKPARRSRKPAAAKEEVADDEQEEAPAAPKRRRKAAPKEEAADEGADEAPAAEKAPRRRRAAPVESKDDDGEAPAPRGRSPQRGGRRTRKFAGE